MHTHTSSFAFAEGCFLLSPLEQVPDECSRSTLKIDNFSDLPLSLPHIETQPRRSWLFSCAMLIALLLHALCAGMLVADSFYAVSIPGAPLTEGSEGNRPILLEYISLARPPAVKDTPPAGLALLNEKVLAEVSTTISPQLTPIPPAEKTPQEEIAREVPQEVLTGVTPQVEFLPEKNLNAPVQPKPENREPSRPVQSAMPAEQQKNIVPVEQQKNTAAPKQQKKTLAQRTRPLPKENRASSGVQSDGSRSSGSTPGKGEDKAEAAGALASFGGSDGPSFKRFVQPEYPAQARRQGITGKVLLRIHITADGFVDRAEVVQSVDELLSAPALAAVKLSVFHPLRRNGKAVPCWTLLPLSFVLNQG